jgi:hypothetical protein
MARPSTIPFGEGDGYNNDATGRVDCDAALENNADGC